ncbi:hypothetical protein MY11210_001090 [Beauveria gryllotalpidicola]
MQQRGPADRQRRFSLTEAVVMRRRDEVAPERSKDPGSVGRSDALLIPGDWLLSPTHLRGEAEKPVSNPSRWWGPKDATQEMERQPTS